MKQPLNDTGVMNLSDHELSDNEHSLLAKGLTFVNTPGTPDMGVLCGDLCKFYRSLE